MSLCFARGLFVKERSSEAFEMSSTRLSTSHLKVSLIGTNLYLILEASIPILVSGNGYVDELSTWWTGYVDVLGDLECATRATTLMIEECMWCSSRREVGGSSVKRNEKTKTHWSLLKRLPVAMRLLWQTLLGYWSQCLNVCDTCASCPGVPELEKVWRLRSTYLCDSTWVDVNRRCMRNTGQQNFQQKIGQGGLTYW